MPRQPRSPATFTQEWLNLCQSVVTSRREVTITCASPAQARSLRAQFNAYKSALSRSDDQNLPLVRAVYATITDTTITFTAREESPTAKLIREALDREGLSILQSPAPSQPEPSFSEMLGLFKEEDEGEQKK